MAASIGIAFEESAGDELDRIVYSGRTIRRAPTDRALDASLAGFDPARLQRTTRRLARRRGCSIHDAEEAVDEELVSLMEKRPEVFGWEQERWLRFLFVRAGYRVLDAFSAARPASTDALGEAGEIGLAGAEACVPFSPRAEEEAGDAPLPKPGEAWSRRQIILALQRFYRYYGRPPKTSECRATNRLPSYATIRRLFGGLDKALIAAGILPADHRRRRRRWTPLDAALACRAFYRRHSYWPSAGDAERDQELPGRVAMLNIFGTTHGGAIREVAEAIIAAAGE